MKKIIYLFLLIALAASGYAIFFYAPEEVTQGIVQKIFYIHVPSAFAMYATLITGAALGLGYLIRRDDALDQWAVSCMEVALLFCTIVLTTGPIWAKPIWGAWWTWDARLTSTFFLWLILIAYFLLRKAFTGTEAKRYSAILALIGLLDVPIIMFAVKLWRGAHPSVLSAREYLPSEMRQVFILCILTIQFLAWTLVIIRKSIEAKRRG
ncbi:MAG: cytochrome C assembly protein [Deltaproteobacteria bacterium CG11_big_fil_rev_8_21_14_0_20_47_16]|nr:MAG: cytochrome C assembly protein [Deltaproteobacteria bacterium CG11_big_fil_rev_8_21_14_0_20_47_16]